MKKNFVLNVILYVIVAFSLSSCSKEVKIELDQDEQSRLAQIYKDQAGPYNITLSEAEFMGSKLGKSIEPSLKGSRNSNLSSTKVVESIESIPDTLGLSSFYIINYKEGGFVILTADSRLPQVLAYSEKNNFDLGQSTEGLVGWLTSVRDQVRYFRSTPQDSVKVYENNEILGIEQRVFGTNNQSNVVAASSPPPTYEQTIEPLLRSNWGQGAGYNNYHPDKPCAGVSNGKAFAGCVAIAIAQVMRHHEYPSNYQWDAMPLTRGADETSRLTKDIADVVHMNYRCDGSGTSAKNWTVKAFEHFGYVGSTMEEFDPEYSGFYNGPFIRKIRNELENNRPVILSGSAEANFLFIPYKGTGHAWVCDGMRLKVVSGRKCVNKGQHGRVCDNFTTTTAQLHMNWGWSGQNDGFYDFGSFTPSDRSYNFKPVLYYGFKKP